MTHAQGHTAGRCPHDRGHITDSPFQGHDFATPDSRRIFCDVCRIQRWLDVEAALALSQADIGLIPPAAATEIARAADIHQIDLDEVRHGIRATRHSLVALLRALQRACSGAAGEFVHYGATTQDVKDTAQALEMREVLDVVDRGLQAMLAVLRALAVNHRCTLMVGRTHARPALPMTFGLKVASWIDELARHAERLQATRSRVLVVQLFGGVGTMRSFQGRGAQLLRAFADHLSLGVPSIAWHVARDRVAEFVTTLAMLAATLARIAGEVRTLDRPDLAELEQGWEHSGVATAIVPHERSPEAAAQVVALARLAGARSALSLEAMVVEHERDGRGHRLEWAAVADVSHYTLAALAILRGILDRLEVREDRMDEHAREAADSICAEAAALVDAVITRLDAAPLPQESS